MNNIEHETNELSKWMAGLIRIAKTQPEKDFIMETFKQYLDLIITGKFTSEELRIRLHGDILLLMESCGLEKLK